MASIVGIIPSPHYTKDELRINVQSGMFVPAITYAGNLKLSALPSDGHVWSFQSPKGSFTLTWKTAASLSGSQLTIGANVLACHTAVVAWLNSHYTFSKHWVATFNPASNSVDIVGRSFGTDYNFSADGFDAPTVYTATLGTNPVNNLQVGIVLRKRTDDNEESDIFFEAIAPIAGNENSAFFYLQDPLNDLTEFSAPDLGQTAPAKASGHLLRYDVGLYDISGVPPQRSLMDKTTNRIAIRGGSRFENSGAFGNFLSNYIVSENSGVLHLRLGKKCTENQILYAYWFNSVAGNNYQVKATLEFNGDQDPVTVNMYTFAAQQYEVWMLPMGIGLSQITSKLDELDLEIGDLQLISFNLHEQFTGALIANLFQVTPDDEYFGDKYFLFENSAGGAEILKFSGTHTEGIEVKKELYQKLNIPSRYWERRKLTSKTLSFRQKYTASTGLLTWEELLVALDLVVSDNVWEDVYSENERYPIEISEGSFTMRSFNRDGQHLFAFEFEYARAYAERSNGLLNNYY